MRHALTSATALMLLACGCGADDPSLVPTNSPPVVARVEPAFGSAGDEITVFGFGFSAAWPENTVIIGDAAASATGYALLDQPTAEEIESITFEVPDDAEAGEGPLCVLVRGRASNADISFTVLP